MHTANVQVTIPLTILQLLNTTALRRLRNLVLLLYLAFQRNVTTVLDVMSQPLGAGTRQKNVRHVRRSKGPDFADFPEGRF